MHTPKHICAQLLILINTHFLLSGKLWCAKKNKKKRKKMQYNANKNDGESLPTNIGMSVCAEGS